MHQHTDLGDNHFARIRKLYQLINQGEISLGGYKKNRIYGTLSCNPGKKMKPENRVFFRDEQEAIINGYRPCARCMPNEYKSWKNSL